MIYNQNLKSATLMKMTIRYQRHIISKIEQANNTECYNIMFGFQDNDNGKYFNMKCSPLESCYDIDDMFRRIQIASRNQNYNT